MQTAGNIQQPVFATLRQQDPTQTLTLRRQFVAEINRRFKALKKVIIQSVVENDCFGLIESPLPGRVTALRELGPIEPRKFQYTRSEEKVTEFMAWLNEQEEQGILEVVTVPSALRRGHEAWCDKFIKTAYQRGVIKARVNLRRLEIDVYQHDPIPTERQLFFRSPFHMDRVGLIFTRVFNELKGVTAAMDQQISRVLARGIAEGKGPYQIARDINDRVDKIGITRARLIARTEIVHTHNEAGLNEYEALEPIIGEPIYVQWWCALDERVRPSHDAHTGRHGKVYTKEEGRALIGEPNCRCALLPWIKDFEGII